MTNSALSNRFLIAAAGAWFAFVAGCGAAPGEALPGATSTQVQATGLARDRGADRYELTLPSPNEYSARVLRADGSQIGIVRSSRVGSTATLVLGIEQYNGHAYELSLGSDGASALAIDGVRQPAGAALSSEADEAFGFLWVVVDDAYVRSAVASGCHANGALGCHPQVAPALLCAWYYCTCCVATAGECCVACYICLTN